MRFLLAFCAAACLSAQTRDPIDIPIDGRPFTAFHAGEEYGRPFLAPLRSASGKILTRRYPMEEIAGESRDHPHHTGLFFCYDDVNGTQFWDVDRTHTRPTIGHMTIRSVVHDTPSTIAAVIEWRDFSNHLLLVEERKMTFAGDRATRTIDLDSTLTAAVAVTFGDTKEGAFAIRLSDRFTPANGLKMIDSEGRTGMAEIWGKRANWVDYTTDIEGERVAVAIFDHPANPRHPTYWHARDYGLFALNPFGRHAFDPKQPESHWTLALGAKLRFRWRVEIHPGDASRAAIDALYRQFAATN